MPTTKGLIDPTASGVPWRFIFQRPFEQESVMHANLKATLKEAETRNLSDEALRNIS